MFFGGFWKLFNDVSLVMEKQKKFEACYKQINKMSFWMICWVSPCLLFQMERARLAREKQMREELQREKDEMEQKMADLQEQVRLSQDALVRFEVKLYGTTGHTLQLHHTHTQFCFYTLCFG